MIKLNKKIKATLVTLASLALATGIVFATYTVWCHRDNTTVQEPLSVEWVTTMKPATTFPNGEYEVRIKIHNVDVEGNGNQSVGVVAKRSDGLARKDICWNVPNDGLAENCSHTFNEKMVFTLAKNKTAEVWAIVTVPGDATPGDEWVDFEVTREK